MGTVLVREMKPGYAIPFKTNQSGAQMAKPNYSYEKRQKELAKKKKQEEKRKRKQVAKDESPAEEQKSSE
jgi:hypothetical protein